MHIYSYFHIPRIIFFLKILHQFPFAFKIERITLLYALLTTCKIKISIKEFQIQRKSIK